MIYKNYLQTKSIWKDDDRNMIYLNIISRFCTVDMEVEKVGKQVRNNLQNVGAAIHFLRT